MKEENTLRLGLRVPISYDYAHQPLPTRTGPTAHALTLHISIHLQANRLIARYVMAAMLVVWNNEIFSSGS